MSPNASAASNDGPAEFPITRLDNLVYLNIMEKSFGLRTGTQKAYFLGVSPSTITRASQGTADIAGLAPAVLGQLFSGASGIALKAQLFEGELRRLHAEKASYINSGKKAPESLLESLQEKAKEGDKVLALLRERYNDMRPAKTEAKILERRTDRIAIRSLEGQLYIYAKNYVEAAEAFRIGLSYFNLHGPADFASKLLLVRMQINWWYAHVMMPDKAIEKKDVSSDITKTKFVLIARQVAGITGDSRLLINVAEAQAVNQLNGPASEHLCDAAEMLSIRAADLREHRPVGYDSSLGEISSFATALDLSVTVESRRNAARANKSAERLDIEGRRSGYGPDDASVNLSGF